MVFSIGKPFLQLMFSDDDADENFVSSPCLLTDDVAKGESGECPENISAR